MTFVRIKEFYKRLIKALAELKIKESKVRNVNEQNK